LLEAAQTVLPPQAIPFDADFFTDLGGHSLLAARFVSIVRETPALAERHAAGCLWRAHAARDRRSSIAGRRIRRRRGARSVLHAAAVAAPLPLRPRAGDRAAFILALMTAQWLGVFVSYMLLTDADAGLFVEMVALLGVYVGINIATIAVSVIAMQMGDHRPHQAGALSAVGRLLFPLVAGAAVLMQLTI
jgi:hypothetical protein